MILLKHLTIRELIELLQQQPDQVLPVYHEGCDCIGEAVRVEILTSNYPRPHSYLLINRPQYGETCDPSEFEGYMAGLIEEE